MVNSTAISMSSMTIMGRLMTTTMPGTCTVIITTTIITTIIIMTAHSASTVQRR